MQNLLPFFIQNLLNIMNGIPFLNLSEYNLFPATSSYLLFILLNIVFALFIQLVCIKADSLG